MPTYLTKKWIARITRRVGKDGIATAFNDDTAELPYAEMREAMVKSNVETKRIGVDQRRCGMMFPERNSGKINVLRPSCVVQLSPRQITAKIDELVQRDSEKLAERN